MLEKVHQSYWKYQSPKARMKSKLAGTLNTDNAIIAPGCQ